MNCFWWLLLDHTLSHSFVFLTWHKTCDVSPLLFVFAQKVESELRQAQEAFSAGEKRMDASKQELGRLRRTADNARKETQTAREEVKLSLASPHHCLCFCQAHQKLQGLILSGHMTARLHSMTNRMLCMVLRMVHINTCVLEATIAGKSLNSTTIKGRI